VIRTLVNRCRVVAERFMGKDIAGRNISVFPDDSFIVSYPRSGSTWLRFLVGNLLSNEPISFKNLEQVIPDIHVNSARHIASIPRPRLLKSHEYFDHRYRKVVYLVRDPRDVVVSCYRYHLKVRRLDDGYPIDRYVHEFLNGELEPWRSWRGNVASWLDSGNNRPEFLLIRYEDLLENTVAVLSRIAEFLDIETSPARLERAVRLSSAQRMRELEQTQGPAWVTIKGSREDIPFIGRAISGGWRSALSESAVATIEWACGSLMERLDYEVSLLPQKRVAGQAVPRHVAILSRRRI
jgi:hypothetical protein